MPSKIIKIGGRQGVYSAGFQSAWSGSKTNPYKDHELREAFESGKRDAKKSLTRSPLRYR
jgi:hypothetical protein